MRKLGKLTTVVLLAMAGVGAWLGVQSIPDLKRYLKMRQM